MARLVPNQVRARASIDRRWPKRDRGSDGWIADKHHRPPSEHIPDARGWVRAIDIDIDGIHVPTVIADFLMSPATWYVISGTRIYRRADDFRPRAYTGTPHTGHIHRSTLISSAADVDANTFTLIDQTAHLYDRDTELAIGTRGYQARQLQALLNGNGASLVLDSDFGPATAGAVRAFQQRRALRADGVAGRLTLAALLGRKP